MGEASGTAPSNNNDANGRGLMRIAFLDMVFAWPPPGGAQADLFHTADELQKMGHEVHLFAAAYEDAWRFGDFDPADLPFPATRVPFSPRTFTREGIPAAFREAVDPWQPDIVFLGLMRYMKPYVIEAFADRPLVSRYYMYEHLCIRDFFLFYAEEVCPNDLLRTPDACRRCALECWQTDIRTGLLRPYANEFLLAGAHTAEYQRRFVQALQRVDTAIVYNAMAADRIADHCPHIEVIPGGVDLGQFDPPPRTPKGPGEKTVILMTGRADDASKGMDVLLDAATGLAMHRDDFEVWVTYDDESLQAPWLKNVGWVDYRRMRELYAQADICVVPSVWAEPFGIVAVEGMAMGLPVVASRVGGLQHIVVPGETGHLFDPGSSVDLAFCLNALLDDPTEAVAMGTRGRRRVEENYTWSVVVQRHYPAILERLAGKGG